MATLEMKNEKDRTVWTWHCEDSADQQKALEQAEDMVGDGWIEFGTTTNDELVVVLYDYDPVIQ